MHKLDAIFPILIFGSFARRKVREEQFVAKECLRLIDAEKKCLGSKTKDDGGSCLVKPGASVDKDDVVGSGCLEPLDHLADLIR